MIDHHHTYHKNLYLQNRLKTKILFLKEIQNVQTYNNPFILKRIQSN